VRWHQNFGGTCSVVFRMTKFHQETCYSDSGKDVSGLHWMWSSRMTERGDEIDVVPTLLADKPRTTNVCNKAVFFLNDCVCLYEILLH